MFWSGGNLVRPLACKAGIFFFKNSSNEGSSTLFFGRIWKLCMFVVVTLFQTNGARKGGSSRGGPFDS